MDWDAIKKLDPHWIEDILQEAQAKLLFETFLNSCIKSDNPTAWTEFVEANPPSADVLEITFMLAFGEYEAWQKAGAAFHGKTGAKLSHARTDDLKAWAYQESKKMTGSDKQKARTLRGRLPTKFEDVSRDPERLIYDHLRAMQKGDNYLDTHRSPAGTPACGSLWWRGSGAAWLETCYIFYSKRDRISSRSGEGLCRVSLSYRDGRS